MCFLAGASRAGPKQAVSEALSCASSHHPGVSHLNKSVGTIAETLNQGLEVQAKDCPCSPSVPCTPPSVFCYQAVLPKGCSACLWVHAAEESSPWDAAPSQEVTAIWRRRGDKEATVPGCPRVMSRAALGPHVRG